MKLFASSSILVRQMPKQKLLTVKFPEQTLAEFHAAAEILGARTSSAMIHQFAMQKIREAKGMVSDEEFLTTVNEKISEMSVRSKEKSESRPGGMFNVIDRASENASLNFSGKLPKTSKSKKQQLDALIDSEVDKKLTQRKAKK